MSRHIIKLAVCVVFCRVVYGFFAVLQFTDTDIFSDPQPQASDRISTAVGDARRLENQYRQWKATVAFDERVALHLNLLTPSLDRSDDGGSADIDLRQLRVLSEISVTANSPPFLWVQWENHAESFYGSEVSFHRLGQYSRCDGRWCLDEALPLSKVNLYEQVRQFVVAEGQGIQGQEINVDNILLVGSFALFQRLAILEMHMQELGASKRRAALAQLLVPVAQAQEASGFPEVFNDLVTQGEDIFFNEAFDGNGRTCGSCHPATNNFTIDREFIATLADDDPLFVAEFVPALIFGAAENLDALGNPRRFENPALMREFGLIVENLDGMGDLANRFTMRSVPHNIGMTVSVARPPNDLTPPEDRTGWSGDGAPFGMVAGHAAAGRVRDFLLGAIVQHFPLTMARSFSGPNPDFRQPTTQELDAVEAFLFAIGRQVELELNAGAPNELRLRDASAEAGKVLFRDGVSGGTARCNACHANAGANLLGGANPGNRNFNTGVELFLQNRITDPSVTVVGEPRPVDGGFATNPDGNFLNLTPQPGFINENFGDKRFNSVSLVEAADSPPFFHNNAVATLEEAIAFYNSAEFLAENGNSIPFNATEITQVANFLRVVNAMDNVENLALKQVSRARLALAQNPVPDAVLSRIVDIVLADTEDAIEVLQEGNLHNSGGLPLNAVLQLQRGRQRLSLVQNAAMSAVARTIHLDAAEQHLENALELMRF